MKVLLLAQALLQSNSSVCDYYTKAGHVQRKQVEMLFAHLRRILGLSSECEDFGLIPSCDEGHRCDNEVRGYVNTRINATLDIKILSH